MPATDFFHQASSSGLYRGRDQLQSMDSPAPELEQEAFQKRVSERFQDLAAAQSDELLSVSWISKLLDIFLCCLEEFKVILFNNKGSLSRPPMDRYVSDFLERSIKALDICNAIREGIEQMKQWQKFLEIILCALDSNQRNIGEGQLRRVKRALVDLAISMLEEKDTGSAVTQRNRSFGRRKEAPKSLSQFRSRSWSLSRSWSAAKQLQAFSSSVVAPKANEITATNGLNVAVFTMNYILLFVMWSLVAAIPCQDRGLVIHFYVSKQFQWAAPVLSLHDKIMEESKKRGRRNTCGLLKEIHEIEICSRNMNEIIESMEFPMNEDKEKEVKQRMRELKVVYEEVKHGLDSLERHVRQVFHNIVRVRVEALETLGQRANGHD